MIDLQSRDVFLSVYDYYARYGNTSSSSIWYEMDYIIRNTNVRSGQRVLQIAFGSGFKCNSMVWLCLNQFQPAPLRPATEKPSKEKDQ